MSSTKTDGTKRSALAAALAVALASAALATAVAAPAQAESMFGPSSAVYASSDEALPGEGRPPVPGPTDPGGPAL